MCKNISKEDRAFWEKADAEARRLRVNGRIPGKRGVTIGSPQKSPEPKKKDNGPAPSPPVKKKEEEGPAPSPQPKHTGNGWNAWRAGNQKLN